ncbi:hypothetical protein CDAR_109381 [Caerostris darwini]|uniref:Uncharacterized protein n=1 Tax=Caerostris darwini TaxID=1538125 RepID=A0AAV4TV37_9ARAC|nr:hypothetical protein CDAR_109381 [Caerostris darwini]
MSILLIKTSSRAISGTLSSDFHFPSLGGMSCQNQETPFFFFTILFSLPFSSLFQRCACPRTTCLTKVPRAFASNPGTCHRRLPHPTFFPIHPRFSAWPAFVFTPLPICLDPFPQPPNLYFCRKGGCSETFRRCSFPCGCQEFSGLVLLLLGFTTGKWKKKKRINNNLLFPTGNL